MFITKQARETQTPSVTERRKKKTCEKPGSVGGAVLLQPDEPVVCSNCSRVSVKARTHRDEYRRAVFASVFQRVFCVHTQAIFADDEPREHAYSFPDIRWSLM